MSSAQQPLFPSRTLRKLTFVTSVVARGKGIKMWARLFDTTKLCNSHRLIKVSPIMTLNENLVRNNIFIV